MATFSGSSLLEVRGFCFSQHHHHRNYSARGSTKWGPLHCIKSLRATTSDEATGSSPMRWADSALPSLLAGVVLGLQLWTAPPIQAVDALKTCTCLLKECRVELARCIADPACAANVACLQTCNNKPDETECQVVIAGVSLSMLAGKGCFMQLVIFSLHAL
ncbi:hypothetical protein L7F22_010210 [Adiantum nelumboides]|nr:hypothetical protein [Adiantum nelumboides]